MTRKMSIVLISKSKLSLTKAIFCGCLRQNHYDVLQVPKDALHEEIRKSFIEKSKECHPDRNPGDEKLHEKFIKLNEAYSILSNPEARALYNYDLATKRCATGRRTSSAYQRSESYKNPYVNVRRSSTEWSDFYNTYGGSKAFRESQAGSEAEYWKVYWENTRKFGGSDMHDGLSPPPKSTLGKEMALIITLLVIVYVGGLIHLYNTSTSVDHQQFDAAHRAWLLAKANGGK